MRIAMPGVIPVAVDGPARAAFTTRTGGASAAPWDSLNLGADGGDTADAVRANRAAVADALGLDAAAVTMVRQVHGADVLRVTEPTHPGRYLGALRGWHAADGLATATPGLPLMVLGADCLPVLLWRRDTPAVAAAHAGWRGLVEGVIGEAVRALGEPARVGAAIGPGIGACCYAVSGDVRARFAASFGDGVVHGEAVDLAASARAALTAAGVPAGAIQAAATCTRCEEALFFSHRGSRGRCGRQAGIIQAVAG